MTVTSGIATVGLAVPRTVAGQYRRLRATHHANVLRWLRNGVVLCTLAAAPLYLWVAIQAGHDIAAAHRTNDAMNNIDLASTAVKSADSALKTTFEHEDINLIGTGSDYLNDITQVSKNLTLAAEGNDADANTTRDAQDELATYLTLSENAVRDYATDTSSGHRLGLAAESYASSSETTLGSTLGELQQSEQAAFQAQRGAWAIDPRAFWWALLGPVIAVTVLMAATAYVLARHFRRRVSPWLWSSLLTLAATAVTVGLFNWNDERHLYTKPWAGNLATLIAAPALFVLAAIFAYLAYRLRLAEYRFQPS